MQQSNNDTPNTHTVTFLVIGGGIAGVTCAETLAICCPEESILLLTESNLIKTVTNLLPVARYLHKFDVVERSISKGGGLCSSIIIIADVLVHIEATNKRVITRSKRTITYRYLCICTGGQPRLIANTNLSVIGIRDTDSVLELQKRLQNAKRLAIIGNGGIATELAYELKGLEVHWVVKDKHIASTFVDPGAAHFFQQKPKQNELNLQVSGTVKRMRYSELLSSQENDLKRGAALGPDWHRNFKLTNDKSTTSALIIHYNAHVEHISEDKNAPDKTTVCTLSTGEQIECDFIVSATGVDPRHEFSCDQPLEFASDGGIAVNAMMETSCLAIYAAGDVCTCTWQPAENWFQMRLWTQARQQGAMAARSMAAAFQGEQIYQDFCFELFGHVTQLFGYEVVLLGRYNGQGLGSDYEILLRSTPGKEYIKFVLQNGRLRGAILIGSTDFAETCENLILNGIDLTPFGDDILNPDIDIEDYFD